MEEFFEEAGKCVMCGSDGTLFCMTCGDAFCDACAERDNLDGILQCPRCHQPDEDEQMLMFGDAEEDDSDCE